MLLYIVLALFSSSLLCKAWNLFFFFFFFTSMVYLLFISVSVFSTNHKELSLSSVFGRFLAISRF